MAVYYGSTTLYSEAAASENGARPLCEAAAAVGVFGCKQSGNWDREAHMMLQLRATAEFHASSIPSRNPQNAARQETEQKRHPVIIIFGIGFLY